MPDEVTFIDLACLLRINQDVTLEKLASVINASIFDASNMAGSLKQKGLIDFMAGYPGPTAITVTDVGKALVSEADAKATEPFDSLDESILLQLSGGKRVPVDLQNTLNIRPKDLALRIYKLFKQGFVIYEMKSGGVDVMLTEAGFLKAKASKPVQAAPASTPQQPKPQPAPAQQQQQRAQPAQEQQVIVPHKKSGIVIPIIIILVLIVVAVAVLGYTNVIHLGI